ncbi:hypothetical protein QJS10_CPA07g01255 [Acorus calamus]|uniref:Sororin C-terminal region domain-containing protein n=1 Tax=Acorus calamus TaxID=4465 RepID=A0AAV9ED63_ACOCL|nr:hypothetical protein QJS10_CPA07g01255 [Acorus calamus]
MEAKTENKPKRKPLSDRTNLTRFTTPGPRKPSKPIERSAARPSSRSARPKDGSARDDAGVGSTSPENPRSIRIAPMDRPEERLLEGRNEPVIREQEDLETVEALRRAEERRKEKGKAVAVEMPLSCPPLARARSFGDKLRRKHKDVGKSKPCSIPDTKSKKKRRHSMLGNVEKPRLPQDFIDKQRAYFKEIDDYELQVEVVSESEIE